MLARKKRVTREEFEEMLQNSFVCHTAYFSLRIRHNLAQRLPHMAVVVSKKVAKGAVDRNLLKRRGRAILNSLTPSLSPTASIILFYKKEGASAAFKSMEESVRQACKQSKLFTS